MTLLSAIHIKLIIPNGIIQSYCAMIIPFGIIIGD